MKRAAVFGGPPNNLAKGAATLNALFSWTKAMERLAKKVRILIVSACEQFIVASVQGFHAIFFALVTIPECICSVTSLSQMAWDQVSSPSPHAPAGDLTLPVIKIWTNHVVEIELPRFRNLVVRFDWQSALILSSLEWHSILVIRLVVDRALESKTHLFANRQDCIATGLCVHDRHSLRIVCEVHNRVGLSELIAYKRKIATLPDVEAVAGQT
jgi:hypothetical protein